MKTKRKILYVFILIAIILLLFSLFSPTWTPKIKGNNSISKLEQININGTKLEVMIRGADKKNPVIIFVHGGPGCSEIPYVRKYQDLLEKNFTIVHYDQRGSGKSYHFLEDYSNLSTDVHVDDLLALTDYITKEFGQQKVLLIGHSFGTYIGIKAAEKAPNKFAAYIGIGQVADTVQSELDSLDYTVYQAKQANNKKDVEKLESLRESIVRGDTFTPRNLVRKYGGASRLIDDNMDYVKGFLFKPEYNLLDMIRFFKGVSISQDVLLTEERNNNITSIVDHLDIPAYFVMGKYDYMTSVNAAMEYFKELEAPVKDFVIFDRSAHYPQFEEKEQFAEWLDKMWVELLE
ncbi:alpha/beta hydrolase [Bacillus sp. FJAT-50079]|uniref:alpha/beta fold hydrolase n=1 Tax=Bacillus sp. FJAT-50079 TaxID=2833577 RepID=UPI001BC92A23|nr:alpha/beta hydrolase [Bacillus sp. FJAT-50079]MBS4209497.1 alpha/beta hydrolase [Bacillus sp. FJAT-50079]